MWTLLIDLVISLAMIPLLFVVGYALSFAVHIAFNLFPDDGQDGDRTEGPDSLSDLADMAFALNLLMCILWLLFFALLCAGRFSPQVKAPLPESVSGLLLHAFLGAWKFVGIPLGFCIAVGWTYYAIRAVVRLASRAARRL